ncbi:helix-turn-helix transcriptional regulator [Viridibacillus arvi]|uniref:helix-turn-helix transcriptional regulator n=1 Tax=Viridibacillus arvi TaxID=263475 RepID=UPI0034CF8DD3
MKYFSSAINGKAISDFQQYDASLTKFEERLNLVENMINNEDGSLHDFFAIYFGEYYDAMPSQNGWLSEEDAVCKTIEGLGTYLLNSKDIGSHRKLKYRFWKSEREFKQYKESENVNTSTLEAGLEEGVEVIDMFYSNDDKNYKLATDNKLYAKDIKEIVEIGALQKAIEIARTEGFVKSIEKRIDAILPIIEDKKIEARLKKIRGNVQNYVTHWIRDMKDNQVAIKVAVKRPIVFRNVLKDEGVANKLDDALMSDEAVNKTLLAMVGEEEDLMSDIGIMIYDFNCLLNRMELSDREQIVVNAFREGYKQKELADLLGLDRRTISDTISRISKKVAKFYVKDLYEKSRKK